MLFNYKYKGNTEVLSSNDSMGMSFAPDTLREPTYFIGELNNKLNFREAISALHDVVVSDMRFRPKDKTEYKKWIDEQEERFLAEAMSQSAKLKSEIDNLQTRLTAVRSEKNKILGPYYKAQREYFNYLYKRDYDAWFVLDPVITVHPDEVFFECFSKDESSYGKLSCSHNVFDSISDIQYGTTNIDYSADLYNEFQKIRTYKKTTLSIDPSGFDVQTSNEDEYREEKIDLPDSWVRGFLQVSSAMVLPATTFTLHPLDMANFLSILKRNKEKNSPRYIEFILEPGQSVRANFKPWDYEVECPRSVYTGSKSERIKIWGRRRLLILERLLHVCKGITVHLLGTGMPSFYVADMGDMQFTLGLSGWSANDWSRMGNFDLMNTRKSVDGIIQQKVYTQLRSGWFDKAENLVLKTGIDRESVLSSLSSFIECGKVIYDLKNGVYRIRELSRENLPMDQLKFTNEREAAAYKLIENNRVSDLKSSVENSYTQISAKVDGNMYPEILVNSDNQVVRGTCNCNFYYQNKLHKGPCEHMIALRFKSSELKI